MSPLLVYTTVPDMETARSIARTLVEERLSACANVFEIGSTYRWKGKLVEDEEVGMVLKTADESYEALEARLRELHPYEVPAVIALSIDRGSAEFLDWIVLETRR